MVEQKIEGKITVTSIRKVDGKNFWGFEAKNYIKGLIWSQTIADDVERNLNIACDGVLKSTNEGKNWNLRSFTPVNVTPVAEKVEGEMSLPTAPEAVASAPRASVKGSAYEKDPVGLAVEIFCAIINEDCPVEEVTNVMTRSINLVKMAQDAFK